MLTGVLGGQEGVWCHLGQDRNEIQGKSSVLFCSSKVHLCNIPARVVPTGNPCVPFPSQPLRGGCGTHLCLCLAQVPGEALENVCLQQWPRGMHRGVWLAAESRSGKELPSANTLRINRLFFRSRSVCVVEVQEDTFPVSSPLCLLALKGLERGAKAAWPDDPTR